MSIAKDLKYALGDKNIPIILRMLVAFLLLFMVFFLGVGWVSLWLNSWVAALIINSTIIGTYFGCKWCEK